MSLLWPRGHNNEKGRVENGVGYVKKNFLSVTAEGIETREQARLLREWSCQTGQGYLFSRPLPAEELAALFHAHSPCSSRGHSAGDFTVELL